MAIVLGLAVPGLGLVPTMGPTRCTDQTSPFGPGAVPAATFIDAVYVKVRDEQVANAAGHDLRRNNRLLTNPIPNKPNRQCVLLGDLGYVVRAPADRLDVRQCGPHEVPDPNRCGRGYRIARVAHLVGAGLPEVRHEEDAVGAFERARKGLGASEVRCNHLVRRTAETPRISRQGPHPESGHDPASVKGVRDSAFPCAALGEGRAKMAASWTAPLTMNVATTAAGGLESQGRPPRDTWPDSDCARERNPGA